MNIPNAVNIDMEDILRTSRIPRTFGLYLLIRVIMLAGGILLFIFFDLRDFEFVRNQLTNTPLFLRTLFLFAGWTFILLSLLIYALVKEKVFVVAIFFAISLPVDMLTIYLGAAASGGIDSPLFHNVYLAIAAHSYFFWVYDFKENGWPGKFGPFKYLLGGGFVSVLLAALIYLTLAGSTFNPLVFSMELAMQILVAAALTATARAIRERNLLMHDMQKDLLQTRYLSGTLSQALSNVINIAKSTDREMLEQNLYEFAAEIGKNLEAEYCAIGFCDKDIIEDVATWQASENDAPVMQGLEKVRHGSMKGSLIGKVLLEDFHSFSWDAALQGDILDPENLNFDSSGLPTFRENAEKYRREILPSGEIRHLLIVPIYSQNNPGAPVGYIHIINRMASDGQINSQGFSELQINLIDMIGSQLGVAFENFQIHQKERALRKEEALLNSLVLKTNLDHVFQEILTYLNRMFDSRVASLWLAAEDGFGESRDALKIVLRMVAVGQSDTLSAEDDILRQKLEFCNIYSRNEDFMGHFLDPRQADLSIQHITDASKIKDCWAEFQAEFGSQQVIAIPIISARGKNGLSADFPIWEQVLGILCLRPRNDRFVFTENMRKQLTRFSRHLAVIIEKNRYQRRYTHIELLRDALEKNQNVPYDQFYKNLVAAVKEVIGAETCSLYMYNARSNALYLKASTASQVILLDDSGEKQTLQTKDYIGKDIYPLAADSITGEIYKQGKPVLIYDVLKHHLLYRQFVESTNFTRHQSLVGAPIIKSNGEKIGVIRCNNKKQAGVRFPVFVQGNKVFMELIARFIAMFVENTETNAVKAEYLNQLAHEFSTPLNAMMSQISFVKRLYHGEITVKQPEEEFKYLSDEVDYLNHLIQDIQFQFGEGANATDNYDWHKKIDLYPIIEKVQKLLKSDARFDREIEIQYIPAIIPEMHVDKMRFEQVIFNMLQNAVKYSHRRGRNIIISYEPVSQTFENTDTSEWHAIHVKNWGIGVENREVDVIFEAYKRGSNARLVSASGTGIGLSVSRKIIENHGGFLKVTRLKSPTIFTIFLPDFLTERRPS